MNIILVDTTKKMFATYVPLALLRLSNLHKSKGDYVELINAGERPRRKPERIYFSFIFLFDYQRDLKWVLSYRKYYPAAEIVIGGISPTLIEEKFKKHLEGKNVEIFTGRDMDLEALAPDYEIAKLNYSYGFTTRGCPNKCEWCVVPRLEGKQKIIPEWQKQIAPGHNEFFAFDNNLLACGSKHFEEVLHYCHNNGIKIDCNQGMDAEILHHNKKIQEVFLKYPKVWLNIRFAWDSERVKDSIIFTMDFIHKNKIRPKKLKSLYMLYDTNDPPEVVFERIKTVLAHPAEFEIKLMRFKDLDTGMLLRKWGMTADLMVDALAFAGTGVIGKGGFWDYMFADGLYEFVEKAIYIREYKKKTSKVTTVSFKQFVHKKTGGVKLPL